MEQSANANLFDLQIDQPSISYLTEAARWAKFLSILGFIFCGLVVIGGVFYGTIFSSLIGSIGEAPVLSGVFISALYIVGSIIVALVMFFPALYLFNFSTKMRRALGNNDQPILVESLKNLKSYFKYYGIITIICLSFYALIILAAIMGAIFAHRP
jgi:hypothetical protein